MLAHLSMKKIVGGFDVRIIAYSRLSMLAHNDVESTMIIKIRLIRFRRSVEGSSGSLNAVQIKQKRHVNYGKDMKALEEVSSTEMQTCEASQRLCTQFQEFCRLPYEANDGNPEGTTLDLLEGLAVLFHHASAICKDRINMKNSLRVSTMEAEKRKSFEDLFEEEEDVGLACPPFDEEDFMAAEASYSDLSEEVFFSRIDNDHKSKSYLAS
ncbi:hypothetical protein POTOM_000253 [Populus tomentosa]|uniref:Uncharacterized protein n=1 Tax=Populus tomentosa TaxID=118781 RepID=A0A8X8AQJ7_POPTO|nr:hypothetical protein POTOM_000250 [Populus tomentosa]KAG6791141.1 hypothetical protein POTOM_000253 [Populus tomentosa]